MTQSKNSAAAGIVSAFLLVLSSSAAIVSTDSKWFIHVWQSDQGLPNNKVTGIAQTADGFLWIATPTGVVRFDGSRFDKIPRETFAPGTRQRTSAVLGDPDGGLWFAMDYGPVIYARAGVIRTFTNHLPSDIVEQMLEDKNHALWVVYRGGTVLRLKKGHSRIYRAAGGLPGYSPCSLALDRNGQLWFAKGGNVGRFQHGRFAALLHLGSQTTVIRLAPSSQGGLWICAGSTLFRLTGGRQPVEIAKYPSATSSDHPTALLED
ncbi:MAG: hypothetical protein KGR98_13075, partial [Verrucomicrobia bacterium]|nr:hypothetical protein [Verrucomicrobiota bacterium]